MTWADRFRRRESIRHSLWLVPLLGALVGMLLAWGADRAGSRLDRDRLLKAVLAALVGTFAYS